MKGVKAVVLIFTLAFIIAIAGKTQAGELPVRHSSPSEIGKTATCPVMNSKFEVTKSTPVIDYKGKSYYFCCTPCVETFKKDPDKYAK
jgi:YHS domain-containing protein